MESIFLKNSSGWDYADLAKTAAEYGGPQKYVNKVYNASRVPDIAIALVVGGATTFCVMKLLSWKRKVKSEKIILQKEIEIDENFDMERGAYL